MPDDVMTYYRPRFFVAAMRVLPRCHQQASVPQLRRPHIQRMNNRQVPPEWRWSHRILRVPSTILAFQP
ncbi:Hypp4407 [Branchiostoma lanceolatum]|uniref:Hypp4407 protein n=1 Tax=Branchiostoma lanceolatum TaxID=7740 RepID=A0A8K0F140_BRALA|nr:Hypp4407 [Branchiostoma lanceolatum]